MGLHISNGKGYKCEECSETFTDSIDDRDKLVAHMTTVHHAPVNSIERNSKGLSVCAYCFVTPRPGSVSDSCYTFRYRTWIQDIAQGPKQSPRCSFHDGFKKYQCGGDGCEEEFYFTSVNDQLDACTWLQEHMRSHGMPISYLPITKRPRLDPRCRCFVVKENTTMKFTMSYRKNYCIFTMAAVAASWSVSAAWKAATELI